MDILAALKSVPEFKDLAESHLTWLAEKGSVTTLKEGDKILRSGEVVENMRIVLEGSVDFHREQAGSVRYLGTAEQGEITGLLPYSRMKAAAVDAIASSDTTIYSLHKDFFPELLRDHH